METQQLKRIFEAALMAAEQPLNMNQLAALFGEDEAPPHADIRAALHALAEDCEDRSVELRQVASGWQLQVRAEYQPWVSKLWQERPPRYSRALLETLALIAYRQPITRGEIEQVRGVSVSSNIMRTLQEREWVRIVGHRDVPGRPGLYGTTRQFLDYFGLRSLDDLPTLAEIKDIESLEPELDLAEELQAAAEKQRRQAEADALKDRTGSADENDDDAAGEQHAGADDGPDQAGEEANEQVDTEQSDENHDAAEEDDDKRD